MSLRFQRLLLILLTLVIILSAILLILYNTRENVSYFYTPSEIDKSDIIILGVPHNNYKDLKIASTKIVYDMWDFLKVER